MLLQGGTAERLLRADEVSIYITPEQAALIILGLSRAVEAARQSKLAEQ